MNCRLACAKTRMRSVSACKAGRYRFSGLQMMFRQLLQRRRKWIAIAVIFVAGSAGLAATSEIDRIDHLTFIMLSASLGASLIGLICGRVSSRLGPCKPEGVGALLLFLASMGIAYLNQDPCRGKRTMGRSHAGGPPRLRSLALAGACDLGGAYGLRYHPHLRRDGALVRQEGHRQRCRLQRPRPPSGHSSSRCRCSSPSSP